MLRLVGGSGLAVLVGLPFLVLGSSSWGEGRRFSELRVFRGWMNCVYLGNDGINVSLSVLRGDGDGYQVRSAKQNL